MPRTAKATVKAEEEPQGTPAAEEQIHSSDPPQFKDTLSELRKGVPPDLIRQRPGARLKDGSTQMFDYIEWHTATDILDEAAPGWSHSIKDLRPIGELVAITVAITIDGVTREGIGTGRADSDTGIKKAEHDALKRAAVKFGVARDLYKKEIHAGQEPGYSADRDWSPEPPPNPKAASPREACSERQVGAIYGKAKYFKMDADAICAEILGCRPEQLRGKAASWFIDYLEYMGQAEKEATDSTRQLNESTSGKRDRNGNVVSMNQDHVAPETRAKLLLDQGNVRFENDGYIVTDVVNGKEWPFYVNKFGDDVIRCTCGDYKTAANTKDDPNYRCAHKIAVELYAAAKK